MVVREQFTIAQVSLMVNPSQRFSTIRSRWREDKFDLPRRLALISDKTDMWWWRYRVLKVVSLNRRNVVVGGQCVGLGNF